MCGLSERTLPWKTGLSCKIRYRCKGSVIGDVNQRSGMSCRVRICRIELTMEALALALSLVDLFIQGRPSGAFESDQETFRTRAL